ncbi:MAG: sulfotransferase domain-containing protein [Bacteroidota bacterium]|nr:sulfotransferase domain-containing protein [Bacteroidota bacterium]
MKTDLLIIGAGRSGTTSIYEYLKNHTQICFSKIKEIHYFSIDELFNRTEKYYHSLYDCQQKENQIFASADTYLFIAQTEIIKRIYDYNSKMKFIIMLRNPIDRAFSGYQYAINNGYLNKKISFIESIKNEEKLLNKDISIIQQNNLCNIYQSKYFYHLKRWTSIFPKNNFLLLKTDELKKSQQTVLNKIADFCNIDKFQASGKIKANTAKKVKSKKFEQILLNRDLKIRKVLSRIVPNKLKQKIFDSKIVDKLHSINKTDGKIAEINEQEKKYAQKIFLDELKNLKSDFNIDLL